MIKYTKSTIKPFNVTADSLKSSTFPTVSASYPGCRCTAAGLSQQPSGPFILVILRLQLDGSQPNFFTVWVCLGSKQGNKTKSYGMRCKRMWNRQERGNHSAKTCTLDKYLQNPTWKARARMLLAAGTSSASHLDLAPINHRTSALGQWATALWSKASKDSLKTKDLTGKRNLSSTKNLKLKRWFQQNGLIKTIFSCHLVPWFFSK